MARGLQESDVGRVEVLQLSLVQGTDSLYILADKECSKASFSRIFYMV